MSLFSIIIPVYNALPFLERCLESIQGQSYKEWEVILVDDGSTDGSAAVCDAWAKKDSRFKVIHQANAGPGVARNRGLDMANGEYISFVDADDTIAQDYVEVLLNSIGGEDMCFFSAKEMTTGHTIGSMPILENTTKKTVELLHKQSAPFNFVYTWNKVYRLDFLCAKNIKYPIDIMHSEDEIFTLQCMILSNNLQVFNKCLYHYWDTGSSADKPINVDEFYKICTYLYKLSLQTNDADLQTYLKNRTLYFCYRAAMRNRQRLKSVWRMTLGLLDKDDLQHLQRAWGIYRTNNNYFLCNRWYRLFFKSVCLALHKLRYSNFAYIVFYCGVVLHAFLYRVRHGKQFVFKQ